MVVLYELVEGSSSSSSKVYKYDVYISFRGIDTRNTFTDHLHKALLDANISTYLDDEEFERGADLDSELKGAIESSRASIIVLSKSYANSSWCLDELVHIFEQRKTSNQIVIPIFYHVEPRHVRKQQSTFGDAMTRHKQKMEEETYTNKRSQLAQKIDRWSKALTEVANLKGMHVQGRLEAEVIKEIVENLYNKLHVPVPQLFGIDDSIEIVTSWLKDASSHTTDVLTILGMGGIGKTSLAKHVYGLHSHEFNTSSFIEDISRRCGESHHGLLDLQKQLCDDISKRSSIQVHEVLIYTSIIENAVARKKVFLVLDDIDSLNQLDALLGSRGFHPGSKIIITTRNALLTENCALLKMKVKPTHVDHMLTGLHETASRQLFCSHAFGSSNPEAGYEEVLKKILKYCGGHPLALVVLGRKLYHQGVAYWEECLEGLEKETYFNTNNVLRKSFDSLPSRNDKELFKHIACFFAGMDRHIAETILNACDINTRSGITNLTDRCLLVIGSNNKLVMHPLLQEMGKFIVHQESPDKPWKRSRLWHIDSFKVLKKKKGKGNVLGLSLDMRMLEKERVPHASFELKTDALSNMDNLMLLQLNYVHMTGSYENFPEELRWLCMHGFPLKSIPSDLPMENLVALDMSYSNIESFDNSDPQRPQKRKKLDGSCIKDKRLFGSLKILNLSFCDKLLKLDGFDALPALESLTVTNCSFLRKVSKSIRKCCELVHIDLSHCTELKKLPRNMWKLPKVETLILDGCNLGESQAKIRDMNSSGIFTAGNISTHTKTSSSIIPKAIPSDSEFFAISLPRSLQKLSLADNNLSTESLPMDFSCLYKLKELHLDGYNHVEFRIQISGVNAPEMYKANNKNTNTKAIASDLKFFTISLPRTLVRLSLTNNNLSNESFPIDLSYLSMLEELYLDKNPIVSLPDSVRSLPRLEILSMSDCEMLTSVEHPPLTLRELILHFTSKALLRKVVFDPEMSPVKLSVDLKMVTPLSFEIEGMVKIQPMVDVEYEVLHSLGWSNILSRGPEESGIQMYFEFGIFSTIYVGEQMPNWIKESSNGASISFTIPSCPNNLKGLNFCSVHSSLSQEELFQLPVIAIKNITKNCTWLYKHCIGRVTVGVGEECLIYLSHWMFGENVMEAGDTVTITTVTDFGLTKECGVSFVYDDGKIGEEEEVVLAYYKSWNHIIGRDLSAYQSAPGVYLLETALFALPGNDVTPYYSKFFRRQHQLLSDAH